MRVAQLDPPTDGPALYSNALLELTLLHITEIDDQSAELLVGERGHRVSA